jgi:RimJ/RimL family protein N-acetyltransferase
MIETERLLLRKFTLDDAEAALEMNRDPKVMEFITWEGEATLESVRALIRDNTLADYEKHGFGRLAVIHKEDDRFIGFTGLKREPMLGEVDVGFRFKRAYWGRGLAFEATRPTIDYGFSILDLDRIVAGVAPGNDRSIRLLERLGLRYEKDIVLDGVAMRYYALDRPAHQNTTGI